MKCNICSKNILNKYKLYNIHHKSKTDQTPINTVTDKSTKHNTQTKWDQLVRDKNLTTTNPNTSKMGQKSDKFCQKRIKYNYLVYFSTKRIYTISQFKNIIDQQNNEIYNKLKTNSTPSIRMVMKSYKLSEQQIKSLLSLRIEISDWINRNNEVSYKILIPNNPWIQLPHLNTDVNWTDLYQFVIKNLTQYKIDNNLHNR